VSINSLETSFTHTHTRTHTGCPRSGELLSSRLPPLTVHDVPSGRTAQSAVHQRKGRNGDAVCREHNTREK